MQSKIVWGFLMIFSCFSSDILNCWPVRHLWHQATNLRIVSVCICGQVGIDFLSLRFQGVHLDAPNRHRIDIEWTWNEHGYAVICMCPACSAWTIQEIFRVLQSHSAKDLPIAHQANALNSAWTRLKLLRLKRPISTWASGLKKTFKTA